MYRVLGFDTATPSLTVAIAAGTEVLSEVDVEPDATGRPRHARQLMAAIEGALGETGGWDGVERIGVGLGPGTFTGLRIGISTARALAQSRDLPIAGVSSLRALAAGSGAPLTLAVLDAKRTEAFAGLYGHEGHEAWEPWVGSPDELGARVSGLGQPMLAVGDGAVRFREELEASGAEVPADEDPLHRLRARHVCFLAARAEARPLLEIKPTYLRRPDAELWRERDRGSTGSR